MDESDVQRLNESFRAEANALGLLYDCADCVHLDTDTTGCSMEYPNSMLLEAARTRFALEENGDLVFCKYFEVC